MATTKKEAKVLSSKEVAAQSKKKRKNAERKRTWVGAKAPKRKPATAKKPTKQEQAVIEEFKEVLNEEFKGDRTDIAEITKKIKSRTPGVTTYVLDHKAAAEALVTRRLK